MHQFVDITLVLVNELQLQILILVHSIDIHTVLIMLYYTY